MKTYYDQTSQRLVFINERATPSFWDNLWQTPDLKAFITAAAAEKFYTGLTRRFLTPSPATKILDGGCGRGAIVYALNQAGYDACGVDYARQTVQKVNQAMPELKVSYGDVSSLDFPDNYFSGYWSLGVIEHYFSGYQSIIKEMQRVVRPSGYLFITFPYLSPLRKIKIRLGRYPILKPAAPEPNNFYQFALNHNQVNADIRRLGFRLLYSRPVDGFKGLKDEVKTIRPLLMKISRSTSTFSRYLGASVTQLAAPISGHIIVQVFKKQ